MPPPPRLSQATVLSLLGKHVDTSLSLWWDHRDMERPRDNGNETKECEVVAGLQSTARQAVLITDGVQRSQDKKCTQGRTPEWF